MTCNQVQKMIVEGHPLPQEAQCHLLHCAECQRFSAAYTLAIGAAPSAEMDHRVLTAVRRQQNEGPFSLAGTLGRGWRRMAKRTLVPIAAALVLVGAVLFALKSHQPVQEKNAPQMDWLLSYSLASEELNDIEWGLTTVSAESLLTRERCNYASLQELRDGLLSLEVDLL